MDAISESVVLEEIRALVQEQASSGPERPEGAFLTREVMAALGYGNARTRNAIRGLIEQGLAEAVGVPIIGMGGRLNVVSGYRLVDQGEVQ